MNQNGLGFDNDNSNDTKEENIKNNNKLEVDYSNFENKNTELNKLYITEIDKLKDNNENIYYKHIIYANKKFYILSNNKQIKYLDHIIYSCNKHNTTKYSGLFNPNGSKKKYHFVMQKLYIIKIQKNIY